MIIILGGNFSNQTFFPFKNKMPNIYSFSYKFLKVIAMSSATKSMTFEQFLLDLTEVFFVLNHHHFKLNSSKFVFVIKGWKLLGFLVSSKGIEHNLEKIQAIHDITPYQSVKDVYCLIWRVYHWQSSINL